MTRTLLLATSLIVGLPTACGESPADARPAQAVETAPVVRDARLVSDSDNHEFGTVYARSELFTTFELTAAGVDDVVVTRIERSCGCLRGELFVKSADGEKQPVELGHAYPPGTRFELRAGLDTKGKSGRLRQTVHIELEGVAEHPVWTLYATVEPYLRCEPPQLAFESFPLHEAPARRGEVVVRSSDNEPFLLSSYASTAGIRATFTPANPDARGRSSTWKMNVELPAGPLILPRVDRLLLTTDRPNAGAEPESDGMPAVHKGEYGVKSVVHSRFQYPRTLNLGVLDPGTAEVHSFRLANKDRDVQIPEPKAALYAAQEESQAFTANERFQVSVETIAPGREWSVVIHCQPGSPSGEFRGFVGVAIEDPEAMLWIPFDGVFAAAAGS